MSIERVAGSIGPLDEPALADAIRRQRVLAKPPGSLGRLETVAIQLAGIRGASARFEQPAIVVMAADHGVAAEGVSAYPASVTAEMVRTFLAGGAAINAIAAVVGARVVVVDMGVATRVDGPGLIERRVAAGTHNLARREAMSRSQAKRAIDAGIGVADALAADGVDLLVPGEMGIANTTSASCVVAVMTGHPPSEVTGRGTGIDPATRDRKVAVIERALARRPVDPVGSCRRPGVSRRLRNRRSRRALPRCREPSHPCSARRSDLDRGSTHCRWVAPLTINYLLAGHQSVEPGHRIALRALRLRPLLRLEMRLGEGSGAALAIPIVRCGCRRARSMATLDEFSPEVRRLSSSAGSGN